MKVTFRKPGGKRDHFYGPFNMESIPRLGDRVEFNNPTLGTVAYNVGEHANYKFINPEYPVQVTVWIYGPLNSGITARM